MPTHDVITGPTSGPTIFWFLPGTYLTGSEPIFLLEMLRIIQNKVREPEANLPRVGGNDAILNCSAHMTSVIT